MSITSLRFVLFVAALVVVYFSVPKKFQWLTLLAASIYFYIRVCGIIELLFVLLTAVSIYGASVWLQRIHDTQKMVLKANKEALTAEEKARIKAKNKKRRRTILVFTLLLNFGIMCACKYSHFAVGTINLLFGTTMNNSFSLIVPLGLSFYTFQSTGYLINVYWNNCRAEKNFLKVLLFISFFPQITQGPISEFEPFAKELYSEHCLDYVNFAHGTQRMIWGFLKKMVLANTLAPMVKDVFANYSHYTGITVFIGAVLYSVQIYADFSGYMDIMCGFCEILGIKLTENFNRPYFSKSIAEYWRRWHISLGEWFKHYIYYPIAVSKWNRKLGKNLTERFGKSIGANLPATIALVAVWLATGLWHGASWAYVAWGGANGLFIIFSMWMEPVYDRYKRKLRINESRWVWRAFQTVRTFTLVTFIKVLPEVGTLSDGLGLWKRIFTNFTIPNSLTDLLPFADNVFNLLIITIITFALFTVSLIQRKHSFREELNRIPYVLRIIILSIITIIIAMFGIPATIDNGGFLYALF